VFVHCRTQCRGGRGNLDRYAGPCLSRGFKAMRWTAARSLDRVETELEKLGLTFADVVEARIYLVDMERYGEFNEIYARRLIAPYPARACVAVAALPRGAQVEIQMVARTR